MEGGNIARAAERLHVSPTALGLQLRNLEATLGVELLARHSRGITTTDAGQLLYQRGNAILRLVDETCCEVAALGTHLAETAALGLKPSIMRLVGADLMVRARAELPELMVAELAARMGPYAELIGSGARFSSPAIRSPGPAR